MKVYYHRSEKWSWTPTILEPDKDMLALSFNNWDDFGVSTTLNAVLYFDGESVLELSLKLLIESDIYSPLKLNELRDQGWDGNFPIPNVNYVSVPSDIDFYNILIAKLGLDKAKEILILIRDAGYLKNIVDDQDVIKLIQHGDFDGSVLREAGARKAFKDGWMLFGDKVSTIRDFTLFFRRYDGSSEPIMFHFNSVNLPYDINILIGPNGIGKSYTLKSLVEYWLGVENGNKELLKEQGHIPFAESPNISKLILISYSPFEEFTIDLSKTNIINNDTYKYFGFRMMKEADDGEESIGISRNRPTSDSVRSILKSLADDKKFGFITTRTKKFETIWSVLQPVIGFDSIAIEIINDTKIRPYIPDSNFHVIDNNKFCMSINEGIYDVLDTLCIDLSKNVNYQSGVIFIRDGKIIDISSGQRFFCYIVVNVVGQIRMDSLVVIDEPELFLHPTLEIEFISLLKKILKSFNSKAILATHSLAIAREVPANCIHVYRKCKGLLEIDHPPFETFGGDMQRISSYVFGDNSISKPFDNWINEKISEYDSPQEFIEALGSELNEEMLIKILNSGA